MMIAPGEAGSDARSDPTSNIGPPDSARGCSLRSWRNGHSADTPDKARTARLQGEVNCCGGNQQRLLLQNTRGRCELLPARCPPCSRAVRALSGVSALCPFLHERRDRPRIAVAAIKYSDTIR